MITNEKNKEDILYILQHLRADDEIEAKTIHGEDYVTKIIETIFDNDDTFFLAKNENNIPYAMGGYVKTEEKGAVVIWLLSTDEIVNHRHFALKKIKEELIKIEKENWFIYNYIFKNNSLAKIWLKKLGFKFISKELAPNDIPQDFELFYKKRELRGLQ